MPLSASLLLLKVTDCVRLPKPTPILGFAVSLLSAGSDTLEDPSFLMFFRFAFQGLQSPGFPPLPSQFRADSSNNHLEL